MGLRFKVLSNIQERCEQGWVYGMLATHGECILDLSTKLISAPKAPNVRLNAQELYLHAQAGCRDLHFQPRMWYNETCVFADDSPELTPGMNSACRYTSPKSLLPNSLTATLARATRGDPNSATLPPSAMVTRTNPKFIVGFEARAASAFLSSANGSSSKLAGHEVKRRTNAGTANCILRGT